SLQVLPSGLVTVDGGPGGGSGFSDGPGGLGGTGITLAGGNGGQHTDQICIGFCTPFPGAAGGGGGSVGRLALHRIRSCGLLGQMSGATKRECPLLGTGKPDGGPHGGRDGGRD